MADDLDYMLPPDVRGDIDKEQAEEENENLIANNELFKEKD